MNDIQTNYQQIEVKASELEAVLRDERDLLNNHDIDATERSRRLAELADHKGELVQVLDTLERNRQFYLRTASDIDQLQVQWQKILGILGRCQQLNIQNGKDIANQARYTHRALEILGLEDASSPMYRADGSTADNRRRHTFGVA